jgi:hypothetical protein
VKEFCNAHSDGNLPHMQVTRLSIDDAFCKTLLSYVAPKAATGSRRLQLHSCRQMPSLLFNTRWKVPRKLAA